MKYIQSREQFIGEAVEVKTNRYQRTHGKKPKGFGQWAFYFDDMGGEPIFVPKAMNYSDAVKWAKGEAKKAGKREIYVGESLNEGKYEDMLDQGDGHVHFIVKSEAAAEKLADAIEAKNLGDCDFYPEDGKIYLRVSFSVGYGGKEVSNLKKVEKLVGMKAKPGSPEVWAADESVTEGEVLLFDELNDSFDDLSTKISKLMDRTDDPKWNRALQSMMNQLEKLISFAAKQDTRLGVIPVNEKRSTPYGELMLDLDAAMKKAIKDGVTTLRYAQDYVKSLERMAKKNAKSFFKSYGDFTEEDWIEDVRYNMANENVNMAASNLDKIFGDDQETMMMFQDIEDNGTWKDMESFIDEFGDEEMLKSYGIRSTAQVRKLAKHLTENYDTEQRKEMAKKGLALPDGSFPIKTVEDLKNAIQAYGRAKDQAKAAKFIAKRAKALNADDLIPDTEDFQKALKEAEFGRIPKFGE